MGVAKVWEHKTWFQRLLKETIWWDCLRKQTISEKSQIAVEEKLKTGKEIEGNVKNNWVRSD